MSESFEEIQKRLMEESAREDQGLRRFIRAELTEERLQYDWEQLRASDSPRSAQRPRAGDAWRDFVDALFLRRVPQRVGALASGMAVVAVAWLALRSSTITLRTPDKWQTAASLPWELKIEPSAGRAAITGDGSRLVAMLTPDFRGPDASDHLQVFPVHFEGLSKTGEKSMFNGTMVVTNVPGIKEARRRKDVLGVLLQGTLRVGSQPEVEVKQSFAP